MRVLKRREVRYDSGPNMTPLVDVVMVILIFLMLAGSIGAARVLQGPLTRGGNRAGSFTQALSLDLRVQEDPTSGSFLATGPDFRIAGDATALLSALEGKRRAYEAAGIQPADVQVVIRPAWNVSYQHLLNVYEAAGRAHFSRVALAASR